MLASCGTQGWPWGCSVPHTPSYPQRGAALSLRKDGTWRGENRKRKPRPVYLTLLTAVVRAAGPVSAREWERSVRRSPAGAHGRLATGPASHPLDVSQTLKGKHGSQPRVREGWPVPNPARERRPRSPLSARKPQAEAGPRPLRPQQVGQDQTAQAAVTGERGPDRQQRQARVCTWADEAPHRWGQAWRAEHSRAWNCSTKRASA